MIVFLFLIFLCWGSFLNVLGYRLVRGQGIMGRSYCPTCKKTLAWYDLIPILSWLWLRGRCRACRAPISWLYPALELATATLMTALYLTTFPSYYFFAYFLLFSALIVTMRSDIESMLISRFVSLALIPVGLLASATGFLPITFLQSLFGSIIGFALLWIPAIIFKKLANKDGIGQGDIELMAMIGSFIGPIGCWLTLLISSTLASIIGIVYLALEKKERATRIPFGPFLAIGTMTYIFLQDFLHGLIEVL